MEEVIKIVVDLFCEFSCLHEPRCEINEQQVRDKLWKILDLMDATNRI